MTTKQANQLTMRDKLVRFGHILSIKAIDLAFHPILKRNAVRVQHEAGVVNYAPEAKVEVQ